MSNSSCFEGLLYSCWDDAYLERSPSEYRSHCRYAWAWSRAARRPGLLHHFVHGQRSSHTHVMLQTATTDGRSSGGSPEANDAQWPTANGFRAQAILRRGAEILSAAGTQPAMLAWWKDIGRPRGLAQNWRRPCGKRCWSRSLHGTSHLRCTREQ